METIGFDGKDRAAPFPTRKWVLLLFALNLIFWVVVLYGLLLLGANGWFGALAFFPFERWRALPTLIVRLVPIVASLAVVYFFRLPERSGWNWAYWIIGAPVASLFAKMLVILVS